LEYDGLLDKLSASTRKGSTLEFDKEGLVMALNSGKMPVPVLDGLSDLQLENYVLWAPTGESYVCSSVTEARALRAEYEQNSPSGF
jgi:hypothetical protein